MPNKQKKRFFGKWVPIPKKIMSYLRQIRAEYFFVRRDKEYTFIVSINGGNGALRFHANWDGKIKDIEKLHYEYEDPKNISTQSSFKQLLNEYAAETWDNGNYREINYNYGIIPIEDVDKFKRDLYEFIKHPTK